MLAQLPVLFINQLNRCVVKLIITIVFVVSLTGHFTGHGLTACTGRDLIVITITAVSRHSVLRDLENEDIL
jgi:hypothetical protein